MQDKSISWLAKTAEVGNGGNMIKERNGNRCSSSSYLLNFFDVVLLVSAEYTVV